MIILSLHHSPNRQQTTLQEELAEQLSNLGIKYLAIPPLHQIAESCAFWPPIVEGAKDPIVVGWLHPRPTVWLLRRHHIVLDESKVVNLQGFSDAASALAAIKSVAQIKAVKKSQGKQTKRGKDPLSPKASELPAETHERWYPIIDGSRCINCGHCLQFCLFGVYELDAEEKVRVANPDQCKTGCPACARICPQSAIIFPLYEKDDAIAGAPNRFVTLDAAARRMFYARTKQICPACGRKPDRKPPAPSDEKTICPECGGPLPHKKSGEKTNTPAKRPAFDDLDLLVEQLDKAMQRRPKPHE